MRPILAVLLACLLVACANLPPPPRSCSTPQQCEIEGYARAP